MHRQWTKIVHAQTVDKSIARFQFSIYISYKTTFFQYIILKAIHVLFWYFFKNKTKIKYDFLYNLDIML